MAEWLWRVAQDTISYFSDLNVSVLSHRETCRGSNPLPLKVPFFFSFFFCPSSKSSVSEAFGKMYFAIPIAITAPQHHGIYILGIPEKEPGQKRQACQPNFRQRGKRWCLTATIDNDAVEIGPKLLRQAYRRNSRQVALVHPQQQNYIILGSRICDRVLFNFGIRINRQVNENDSRERAILIFLSHICFKSRIVQNQKAAGILYSPFVIRKSAS